MPPPRQEQQPQEAPPAPPPPPVENDDVAMDQINLSVVPEMFRKDVYKAANEVREWSKKQSQSWDQPSARRFNSKTFPWQTAQKNWQMLKIKQERLSITEYFCPSMLASRCSSLTGRWATICLVVECLASGMDKRVSVA
jgi:hypothetical protein